MLGVWDAVDDTVCNAVVSLILEFPVLLLRDVNDYRKVIERGIWADRSSELTILVLK